MADEPKKPVMNFGLKGKAKSRAQERAEAAAAKAAEIEARTGAPASSADRPPRKPHPDPQREKVLWGLERGYPMAIAAPLAGVVPGTVRFWMQRDEEFGAEVLRLEGERRAQGWDGLERAGEHWRREAWKLESAVPELRRNQDPKTEATRMLMQLIDELKLVMPKESHDHLLNGLDELARLRGGAVMAPPQALGASDVGGDKQTG